MTLIYENETDITLDLGPETEEELAGRVVETALAATGCPWEAQVNVLVTDAQSVRSLNQQFRGIDRETDVLSFPMQEYPAPADFSGIDEADSDAFDPDTGELLLGDIVLNAQRVISQAEEYGHSCRREFAFLIAHSVLHLTGFDHMQEEERAQMEEMQRTVMEALRIPR
jgi:probable rRNA maturation factor